MEFQKRPINFTVDMGPKIGSKGLTTQKFILHQFISFNKSDWIKGNSSHFFTLIFMVVTQKKNKVKNKENSSTHFFQKETHVS